MVLLGLFLVGFLFYPDGFIYKGIMADKKLPQRPQIAAADSTTSTIQIPPQKQVNAQALSYLLNETVAHAVRTTIKHKQGKNSINNDTNTHTEKKVNVSGRVDFLSDASNVSAPSTLMYINKIGYNVGYKTAQILLMDNSTNTTLNNLSSTTLTENPLEAMKFICRDVWKSLFGKQMDNLRTNHIGTFVLIDDKPLTYSNCNYFYEMSTIANPSSTTIESSMYDNRPFQIQDPTILRSPAYLEFCCGVIFGVLQCLGIPVTNVSVQPESIHQDKDQDQDKGKDKDKDKERGIKDVKDTAARSVLYTVETR